MPTLLRPSPSEYASIGKPTRRIVGRDKVTGGVRYAAEIRPADTAAATAYAFPATAKVAAGRITGHNAAEVARMPGVIKVYTHDNLKDLGAVGLYGLAGRGGSRFSPMESDEVRYGGQIVGVVTAETIEAGEAAVAALAFDYAEGEAHATLHDRPTEEVYGEERGNLEVGRREGSVSLELTLHQPMHHHNPIEPPATLAVWDGPQLTVYEPSQGVISLQTFLGRALKMPVENVRVISEYIGGGFGIKGVAWYHTPLTALVARDLDRPVKMLPSREDMYGVYGNRPESEQRIRISATPEGKLTAYEVEALMSTSMSDNYIYGAAADGHLMINSCPNAAARIRHVRYNSHTPVPMRSPGEAESHYAHSVAMDVLAERLGMDVLDVHEANYADTNLLSGNPWSVKALREAWTAAAERIGWERHRANLQPRSLRTDDGTLVGLGMSIGAYPNYQSIAYAKVRMDGTGRVRVLCGSQSLGQGNYTVMAQAAAESLGIDAADVLVDLGDTDLPPAQLTGGSRSASAVTGGVMAAAEDLKRVIGDIAVADEESPLYGEDPENVNVQGTRAFAKTDPSKSDEVGALMRRASQQYLEGFGSWGGKTAKDYHRNRLLTGNDFLIGIEIDGKSSYSFLATFAEVHVHPTTGMYQIARIVSGYDCGQVMNPKLAESQCRGGIGFAIGHACSEETAFDPVSRRIVNGNIADYHVAVNADVPDIEVIFVNEPDYHAHPIGMKGVGEVAGTGAAGAILNALYHATGKRVTELPAYPEKLI